MNCKHFRSLLFLLAFIAQLSSSAQNPSKAGQIVLKNSVQDTVGREKIYTQFDKTVCTVGDTLWFKIYLVDASVHQYSTTSGLVYAEMIDNTGEIIQSVCLPTVVGLTWGGFAIDPKIYKTGNYTFRAYSNWMKNFGENSFFKQEINVLDLENSTEISTTKIGNNAASTSKPTPSVNIQRSDIDIQFLPEGGTLIEGRSQQIAYKAIDVNGKGVPIAGDIVDAKQQKVAQIKSNQFGMGIFEFEPKIDETYSLRLVNPLVGKSVDLPKAKPAGITLQVSNSYHSDSLSISVMSSQSETLSIVGQARGIICFTGKIAAKSTVGKFKIPKNVFPTGVCQILIKNEEQQILNERSFFINHHDELKLQLKTQAITFKIRDSIPLKLMVKDFEGNPISGSFSLAVTADQQVQKDSSTTPNILSYLLLAADLRGTIENPNYYFINDSEQKHNELDALLLTQGWVSYHLDPDKKPIFSAEKEYLVSGKINNISNQPVKNGKVILLSTKDQNLMMEAVSDEEGNFVFKGFQATDSAEYVIRALNSSGKKGTIGIEVDEFKPAPFSVASAKKLVQYDMQPLDSFAMRRVDAKKQTEKYAGNGIALREVNIKGKKVIKGSFNLNGPGEADQTLTEEDLKKANKKTLMTVLEENVKGFKSGFIPKKKQMAFFINFNIVKLIIDGVDVDTDTMVVFAEEGKKNTDVFQIDRRYNHLKYYLDYFTTEDIVGVEVMSQQRTTARYGTRFNAPYSIQQGYTFVEVTTKTGVGRNLKKAGNLYLLRPKPFGDTKVFYSPRYTTANRTDKKPDLRSTLFWNPNLVTDKNGEATSYFFSSDEKGNYTVWVEGADMQGNFGYQTMKIKIE